MSTLFIRNMVCDRCIRVVRQELEALGLDVRRVVLGEVEVGHAPGPEQTERIRTVLGENGFELIEDRRKKLIEQVRLAIIGLVHGGEPLPRRFRLSSFIRSAVGEEYQTVSALFSSVEGVTIEHFFILQRIERVKELLKYGDRPLKDIAWDLGYSSTQHLSNQFRQVTGMTPGTFRRMGAERRPLDKVGRSKGGA